MVGTGPYSSYPTNLSAAVGGAFPLPSVYVSANSDVIFSLAELRFRNHT